MKNTGKFHLTNVVASQFNVARADLHLRQLANNKRLLEKLGLKEKQVPSGRRLGVFRRWLKKTAKKYGIPEDEQWRILDFAYDAVVFLLREVPERRGVLNYSRHITTLQDLLKMTRTMPKTLSGNLGSDADLQELIRLVNRLLHTFTLLEIERKREIPRGRLLYKRVHEAIAEVMTIFMKYRGQRQKNEVADTVSYLFRLISKPVIGTKSKFFTRTAILTYAPRKKWGQAAPATIARKQSVSNPRPLASITTPKRLPRVRPKKPKAKRLRLAKPKKLKKISSTSKMHKRTSRKK